MLKYPKGIRDVAEWYMSTASRRDYIYKVFERQCEINLANLERVHEAVGDRVTIAQVNAADFGMQQGPLFSLKTYRDLFKPFQKALNDWIHQNTSWKTFIHSCGAVMDLIPDFIEAGFDILNPVQTSAAGMDPAVLKRRFGDQLVFMGGGVDTQHTLPFGTAEPSSPGNSRTNADSGSRWGLYFQSCPQCPTPGPRGQSAGDVRDGA